MSYMNILKSFKPSAGLLMTHSKERTTPSMESSASGDDPANPLNRAKIAILTEVDGEYILTFARGDHDCERWIITRESLRAITLMGVKKLL